VGAIAEIKAPVPTFAGDEVGARRDCLCLQSFEGHIRVGLGGNDRSDRRLKVHGDDGEQRSGGGRKVRRTVILASDFSGDFEEEVYGAVFAAGERDGFGSNRAISSLDHYGVVIQVKLHLVISGTRVQKERLITGVDDDGCRGRSSYHDLVWMKQAKDADAHVLCERLRAGDHHESQQRSYCTIDEVPFKLVDRRSLGRNRH